MNLDIVNEDGDPTKKNWDLSNKHEDFTKKNVDSRNQNGIYVYLSNKHQAKGNFNY